MKAPPELAPADLHMRELTDAEEEAYRGGFFAIRRRPEAKQILQNAVNLDPKLALAYQNLGIDGIFGRQSRFGLDVPLRSGAARSARRFRALSPCVSYFFGAGGFPQDSKVEEICARLSR